MAPRLPYPGVLFAQSTAARRRRGSQNLAGRSGRTGLAVARVGLMLPLSAWAGSAQATLTVGVVVPARFAVRVAGSLAASHVMAAGPPSLAWSSRSTSRP